MTPICTYEQHNLGDQLIFLHLLRALAKANPSREFWHFCGEHHTDSLLPVVEDLPNIKIGLGSAGWRQWGYQATNVWKNAHDYWVKHPLRWDWSGFQLAHHRWVAEQLGLRSPFTIRENLLFDYPALNPNGVGGTYFYDFLIINSEPCSGQFAPMRQHGTGYLDDFARKLAKQFTVITTNPVPGVECTRDTKKSITDIGRLSLLCRNHIMVATGPMWPTLSTTNHHHSHGRTRIVLLDNGENLNMPGITQCRALAEVERIAKQEGWI